MRSNIEGCRISNVLLNEKVRLGHGLYTSTGSNITMDDDMPPLLDVMLSAAASLLLPAAASGNKGAKFDVMNNSTAALTLTVKTSTGGAILGPGTATSTIRQGAMASFISNGSVWTGNSPTAT